MYVFNFFFYSVNEHVQVAYLDSKSWSVHNHLQYIIWSLGGDKHEHFMIWQKLLVVTWLLHDWKCPFWLKAVFNKCFELLSLYIDMCYGMTDKIILQISKLQNKYKKYQTKPIYLKQIDEYKTALFFNGMSSRWTFFSAS